MKKETKNGTIAAIKHFCVPYTTALLTPFLAVHPEWTYLWYSAIGLFGVYMEYNQDKVNDFVQMIEANPSAFVEEIINTEEFKEGFLITFQEFIKTRGENKREAVKRIFLGFTNSKDKTKFELERMYDCLNKISVDHIRLLGIVKKNMGRVRMMNQSGNHMPIYTPQYDDLKYLVSLGILSSKTTVEMEETNNFMGGTVKIMGQNPMKELKQEENAELSNFGGEFVKFITEESESD